MKTQLYHLHAVSPVHVGIGQAIGTVDLPIARERAANLPMIPGSAIKGVLRDAFQDNQALQKTLFGPAESSNPSEIHAGALAFGDALLLALPVRSLVGMVSFVTSPFLLSRYQQAALRSGCTSLPEIPHIAQDNDALVAESCKNTTRANAQDKDMLILEDLDLVAKKGDKATVWAQYLAQQSQDTHWTPHFESRFAIVSDSVLGYLADTATEIRSRIRIDDEKRTVKKGALWYEENLPAETLLYGILGLDQPHDGNPIPDVGAAFTEHLGKDALIQVGGKASVGRGLVRFLI